MQIQYLELFRHQYVVENSIIIDLYSTIITGHFDKPTQFILFINVLRIEKIP